MLSIWLQDYDLFLDIPPSIVSSFSILAQGTVKDVGLTLSMSISAASSADLIASTRSSIVPVVLGPAAAFSVPADHLLCCN